MSKILLLWLIVAISWVLHADILYLHNKKKLKGRIIKVTKTIVYFKHKGKILSIKRKNIKRIKKKKKVDKPDIDLSMTPVALIAKARQIRTAGDYQLALKFYRRALEKDEASADRIEWELADMAVEFKKFADAEQQIRKLLQRNPNHAMAHLLMAKLGKKLQFDIGKVLRSALSLYRGRHYRQALAKFIGLVNKYPHEQLQKASQICKKRTGASLEQIMIDSRFHLKCPVSKCKQGIIVCSLCRGKGRIRKYRRTVVHEGTEESATQQIYCPRCKGMGSFTCRQCRGTGFYFGKITEFERKLFIKTLMTKGLEIGKNAADTFTQNEKRRQQDVQLWSLSSYNVIAMTRKSIHLLKNAAKENPALESIAGIDLQQRIAMLEKLRKNVFISIAMGYLAASEHNYQRAVNISGKDTVQLTPPARTMKAQEAWTLAESARLFLLQAYDENRSSISPLRGDLERLLARVDQHIIRCRRTYFALKKLEQNSLTPKYDYDLAKYLQKDVSDDK